MTDNNLEEFLVLRRARDLFERKSPPRPWRGGGGDLWVLRKIPDGSAVTSALEESAAAFSERQQIHSKRIHSKLIVMMYCDRC